MRSIITALDQISSVMTVSTFGQMFLKSSNREKKDKQEMSTFFQFPEIIKLTAIVKFDEIYRKDIEQVFQH